MKKSAHIGRDASQVKLTGCDLLPSQRLTRRGLVCLQRFFFLSFNPFGGLILWLLIISALVGQSFFFLGAFYYGSRPNKGCRKDMPNIPGK